MRCSVRFVKRWPWILKRPLGECNPPPSHRHTRTNTTHTTTSNSLHRSLPWEWVIWWQKKKGREDLTSDRETKNRRKKGRNGGRGMWGWSGTIRLSPGKSHHSRAGGGDFQLGGKIGMNRSGRVEGGGCLGINKRTNLSSLLLCCPIILLWHLDELYISSKVLLYSL